MTSRHLPLSTLPPGAVIHMEAGQFIDLVEAIYSLEARVVALQETVEKWGLTRQQIADLTGRSVATVGEWVREGKMAGGRRHYLNENALTGLTTVSDFNEFYNLFNNSSPESR